MSFTELSEYYFGGLKPGALADVLERQNKKLAKLCSLRDNHFLTIAKRVFNPIYYRDNQSISQDANKLLREIDNIRDIPKYETIPHLTELTSYLLLVTPLFSSEMPSLGYTLTEFLLAAGLTSLSRIVLYNRTLLSLEHIQEKINDLESHLNT